MPPQEHQSWAVQPQQRALQGVPTSLWVHHLAGHASVHHKLLPRDEGRLGAVCKKQHHLRHISRHAHAACDASGPRRASVRLAGAAVNRCETFARSCPGTRLAALPPAAARTTRSLCSAGQPHCPTSRAAPGAPPAGCQLWSSRRRLAAPPVVSIQPGSTVFTRARPASVAACAWVSPSSPAFAAAYASLRGSLWRARVLEMCTMEALGASSGRSVSVSRKGPAGARLD